MIKTALIEDDDEWSVTTDEYVKRFSSETGISIGLTRYRDAETFLADDKTYDIVLMDIELPGMNGMDAAGRMREDGVDAVLLFITNVAQFALNGYEVDATDYMVKPVAYFVFAVKFHRAVERVSAKKYVVLRIKTDSGVAAVRSSELKYVEIIRHYAIYHTTSGEYRTRGVLKDIEPQLSDYDFVRCNNCYLVNLGYVRCIRGYTADVDGDELLISHPRRSAFVRALNDYLGGGNYV